MPQQAETYSILREFFIGMCEEDFVRVAKWFIWAGHADPKDVDHEALEQFLTKLGLAAE